MGTHRALRGGGLVDDTAFLQPSAYVSGDSFVDQWSYLGCGVVLEAQCNIDTRVYIDDGAHLIHAQVGPYTTIGKGAIVTSGVSIGTRCIICPGARVTADVPDDTTVTSDCCGGGSEVAPKFSLLASINYAYDGPWANFEVPIFAAAATADWFAAGEPAVPLDFGYTRPNLGVDDMTVDRIILSGYFARSAFTPAVDAMTFSLVTQASTLGSYSRNSNVVGPVGAMLDLEVPNMLLPSDGLGLTLNIAGAASGGSPFLTAGFLVSLYHKNY